MGSYPKVMKMTMRRAKEKMIRAVRVSPWIIFSRNRLSVNSFTLTQRKI
jgi:hypothetical protein